MTEGHKICRPVTLERLQGCSSRKVSWLSEQEQEKSKNESKNKSNNINDGHKDDGGNSDDDDNEEDNQNSDCIVMILSF